MSNIKVKSTISYEMYKNFFSFNFKRRKSYKFVLIIGLIALLYGIYIFITTLTKHESFGLDIIIPFAVFVVIYIGYFVIYKVQLKSSYNKNKDAMETPLIYEFDKNELRISMENKKGEPVVVSYKKISGVVDTPNAWYIVLNTNQTYLVAKNVIVGDTKDVMAILRNVVYSKYTKA